MIDELVEYLGAADPHRYSSIAEAVIPWMEDHDMDTTYAGELEIIIEAAYRCGREEIFAVGEWS